MRNNELMVGDWVYMKAHRGFDSQYIKVESIPDSSSDTHYGHIGAYPISEDMDFRDIEDSHLEPIPLTPEILEKNGFSQDPLNGHVFIFHEKSGEVIYYEYGPKYGLTIDNQFATIQDLKIKYVHELQHALRLCGIDKTIEL
jgi:hypothetical protein